MVDYTFTKTVQFESKGRNEGPTYKAGKTYDLDQEHGDRWVRRGVAYEGKPEPPKPAEPASQPQSAPAPAAAAKPEPVVAPRVELPLTHKPGPFGKGGK